MGLAFSLSDAQNADSSGVLTAAAVVGGSLLIGGLVTLGAGVTTYELHDRTPHATGRAPAGARVSASF